MKKKNLNKKIFKEITNKITKVFAVLISTALIAQTGAGAVVDAAISKEQVVYSYTAVPNGQAVINNLLYTDLNNAGQDLKDAVYQNGALGLFPSMGSKTFNQNGQVSKEMALYLIYMAANRAQDINVQGQALNAARTDAQRKTNPQEVLFDGSLQLAANEGLITLQELADAMQQEQAELEAGSFRRNAAVTRQEFAAWLAKALMLPPVYQQQELLNNFTDWRSVKPENIPYIEAILENKIMSGDGSGRFNPGQGITRQQAARILKNAENIILPLRSMEKRTATIEDIQPVKDTSSGYRTDYLILLVRGSNGLLDEITVEARYQQPATTSNELTGTVQPSYRTELPVFKNGQITNSKSLKTGDMIEYIAGIENKVAYYARVLSNSGEISYVAAYVNSVSSSARTMNITPLKQAINYPNQDISSVEKKTYANGNIVYENYSYSNNAVHALTKAPLNVSAIKPESIVIVGIQKNMITELVPITVKKEKEQGLVSGIVEENNPQLGFITLYNEDGTGRTPLSLSELRIFNYADPNEIEVYKQHQPAELDDIEAGDTVFIRVDDTGRVVSVSGVSNYSVRYGKVLSKKVSSVLVETDQGQQSYAIDGANIIKDGKLAKYSQLKEGDRVKLLINEAPNVTILKELTIETGDRLVANVYKGTFEKYDDISDNIILSDPWVLRKGQWVKDVIETFKSIKIGDDFTAYYDGKERGVKSLNTYLKDASVYIVSEKDYGGGEYGVSAAFVDGKEVSYNDRVYSAAANRFTLEKAAASVAYDAGTIVIKDGRLVKGNSVASNDYAYVVANRDNDTDKIIAGVVSIEQRPGIQETQLYRGRIASIDEFKTVTLQSYSKLNGNNWDYANTPMTFTLTSNTRITDTDGIVGQGDFNTYNGAQTFKDRTIYILADDTRAVEISTAPFGNYSISGVVRSTTGGEMGEDGYPVSEPQSVELINCRYYEPSSHLWVNMKDSSFSFLQNTLILKNNQRIMPSELKKGDKIKVLKRDNTISGDAYIIIVEE